MRIIPIISQFNPNRVLFPVKGVTIWADAGSGRVDVTKKGRIIVQGLKNLGLSTEKSSLNGNKDILIKDSKISCLYCRDKIDTIEMINSRFPKAEKTREWPKLPTIITYTNRP